MSFRLFGVNVEIQITFWITSILLFGMSRRGLQMPEALIWVLVVFVSILVHEYGHAFAVMRHGIEPEIALHGMGGTTSYSPVIPLRRRDEIIISLAGPFAGFALGGVLIAAMRLAPTWFASLPPAGQYAVTQLFFVNIFWGLVNLAPVLPFDGGHVLENALGPRRPRLTAGISTAAAVLVAAGALSVGYWWGVLLFGFAAFQSYRRFVEAPGGGGGARTEADVEGVAAPLMALLQSARHALGDGEAERAAELAQRALGGDGGTVPVSRRARREALEVIAWAHLLGDRVTTAAEVLGEAKRAGEPDPALTGAVLFAQKELAKARKVLEAARAKGDDRKEIIGPLVQILLAQKEIAEAAAVALAVVDSLSDEDARRMASLAYEGGAFTSAARLWEAIFDRDRKPEDAYDAARAEAQGGQPERALDLLRRAVEAGFTDRARAWSDAALSTLRAGSSHEALEAVLPRP